MTRNSLLSCLALIVSVLTATVSLLVWTYALVVAIGVGVGDYLNWPDLSHLPGGQAKSITFALLSYVAMASLVTGVWPALRIGLWVWRKSAGWLRRGKGGTAIPS